MKTILLIDDEADFLASLQSYLKQYYRVLTAYDGEEGIRLALASRPSLILCDILMPKKDGYAVVRELRAHADTRDTPILLLTAVADTGSLMDAKEIGATDYLIKPVKMAELPDLIAGYIRTGPTL